MIDLHSHILPGQDDGAQSLEAALAMARMAVDSGVTAMAATPHCAGDRTREVYAAIAPRGCIWTAPDWLWDKKKGEFDFTHNKIEVEWRWMQELGVKEHFVVHSGDVCIEC